METAIVEGRFVNKDDGEYIESEIEFQPSRFWVDEHGVQMATLAPKVNTNKGRFRVELTTTGQREGDYGWHYTVKCPVGTWTIKVDEPGKYRLKDLLPTRFSS